MTIDPNMPTDFRSGFACLVGRPNAGKSTLTNAMVGNKVVITSDRPQTTRRTVRGIVNRESAQLIVVDTPGLHRPRTLLGERLNDLVYATWTEVDVIGLCLPATETVGPGDKFLATELSRIPRATVDVIVTKTDIARPEQVMERLDQAQSLCSELGLKVRNFVPVSAMTGENVDELLNLLSAELPLGPPLYGGEQISDEPEEQMIAELIREAALSHVDDELPHSVAVTIDEMSMREDRADDKPLMDIHATIHVERESQKPIIIGKRGSRLKVIGTNARHEIKKLVGVPVYLNLHVRVAKDWQKDPKQLRRLGF